MNWSLSFSLFPSRPLGHHVASYLHNCTITHAHARRNVRASVVATLSPSFPSLSLFLSLSRFFSSPHSLLSSFCSSCQSPPPSRVLLSTSLLYSPPLSLFFSFSPPRPHVFSFFSDSLSFSFRSSLHLVIFSPQAASYSLLPLFLSASSHFATLSC